MNLFPLGEEGWAALDLPVDFTHKIRILWMVRVFK